MHYQVFCRAVLYTIENQNFFAFPKQSFDNVTPDFNMESPKHWQNFQHFPRLTSLWFWFLRGLLQGPCIYGFPERIGWAQFTQLEPWWVTVKSNLPFVIIETTHKLEFLYDFSRKKWILNETSGSKNQQTNVKNFLSIMKQSQQIQ